MVDLTTHQEAPKKRASSAFSSGIKIETGADKLVSLILDQKRVELSEATKKLGVSQDLVKEWAEVLEDEGLIGVEYSLSKTYLVQKQLTKSEVQQKYKEYANKKDAFVRKVDIALNNLTREIGTFEGVKKQYEKIQDELGQDADTIREEVNLLSHFEDLKKSVDHEIATQKAEYQNALNAFHTKLAEEERRYNSMLEQVETENKSLKYESTEVDELKEKEEQIMHRISTLQDLMHSFSQQISTEEGGIKIHEQKIKDMRNLSSKLQEELADQRRKSLEPLMRLSHDQEQRIMRIQNEILKKVKARYEQIEQIKGKSFQATKTLSDYFERRASITKLIDEIDTAERMMQKELTDLIVRAKAFNVAAQNADMNQHISHLESIFSEFGQKKETLKKKIESLKNMLLKK